MGSKKQRHVVVGENGDPCPRCGKPTEIRTHPEITEKHLRQPFYYSRWFYCLNPDCRTKQIMPDRYMVWPDTPERRLLDQLTPPTGFL